VIAVGGLDLREEPSTLYSAERWAASSLRMFAAESPEIDYTADADLVQVIAR
jgi:hypothetical protein